MTMPEENRAKTGDTDQNLPSPDEENEQGNGEERDDRSQMRAALEDEMKRTGTTREDFE
ncbi:hypothetical protein ACQEU5_10765 [Marinactinospora thermotolerans]|uniref:Uncharacterized protein n=1 Tax=Marinactinospora thermotolerans DSM 45154 TaxID=1122192 RepID=A0A1T4MVJ3_9ACTN|nr:hypothetical protein [Marinactinospora thermotolerans]SJZ70668.1 hypothetical protein SAMN02745673_01145 [Marinactinospora thermotolerans DSM 45154]